MRSVRSGSSSDVKEIASVASAMPYAGKTADGFSLHGSNFLTNARIVSGLIGSEPHPNTRIDERSQRAICSGLARLVTSAYAKLGGNVRVRGCWWIRSSHTVAFLMKSSVGM